MKRFALNKISIAKVANLQIIKGGIATPPETSFAVAGCTNPTADDCVTDDCQTGGTMPCTNTSIDGHDPSNP